MARDALLVFVKYPEAGKVKTRLCPPLTPEQARELYECFLKDSILQYDHLALRYNFDLVLSVTPATEEHYFVDLLTTIGTRMPIPIITQPEGDLGQRLHAGFDRLLESGYHKVIVIGSDHPTLPDEFIVRAFVNLDTSDSVIGPSEDGGYYLLGLKVVRPEWFENIPWSTSDVDSVQRKKLSDAGRTCFSLPAWYDVDDGGTLKRMADEINRDPVSRANFTKVFINHLGIYHG